MNAPNDRAAGYNFAYLDEQTKRMIRRAILKAIAIPGYQVPFASREMPMPYGWGTGGVQVTASIIGPDDVLKVIDQGADDTTNAVSIRGFFAQGRRRRDHHAHRPRRPSSRPATASPRRRSREDQILVYQVPIPEPLRFLEPRETETRKMHALEEYGLMHVKLYEDIARHGQIATTYAYPVKVEGRYVMDPSPIPKFDNPKMHMSPALQLFGAGREKRIYAVPPYTERGQPRLRGPSLRGRRRFDRALRAVRRRRTSISTRSCSTTAAGGCSSAPTPTIARSAASRGHARRAGGRCRGGERNERRRRCSTVEGLTKLYGAAHRLRRRVASTSGRARCWRWSANPARARRRCSTACRPQLRADRRQRPLPHARRRAAATSIELSEAERRFLMRTDWGFVHQNPADGLRMSVSAGGNVGERLMAVGERHYGRIRDDGASTGSTASRSTPTASTTRRAPSPAACASACRSPATW